MASVFPVREGFQSKGRQTSFGGAVVARGHTCGVRGGRLGVALGRGLGGCARRGVSLGVPRARRVCAVIAGDMEKVCGRPRYSRCARGLRGDCGRHGEGMRMASVSPAREGFPCLVDPRRERVIAREQGY
jgi:hypothetical protein